MYITFWEENLNLDEYGNTRSNIERKLKLMFLKLLT